MCRCVCRFPHLFHADCRGVCTQRYSTHNLVLSCFYNACVSSILSPSLRTCLGTYVLMCFDRTQQQLFPSYICLTAVPSFDTRANAPLIVHCKHKTHSTSRIKGNYFKYFCSTPGYISLIPLSISASLPFKTLSKQLCEIMSATVSLACISFCPFLNRDFCCVLKARKQNSYEQKHCTVVFF